MLATNRGSPGHGRRKDFFQGRAKKRFFQRWPKLFFLWGAKSFKIKIFSLETKKTTFFDKNAIGKRQMSKSRGPWLLLRPLPTPVFMARTTGLISTALYMLRDLFCVFMIIKKFTTYFSHK